MHKGDHVSLNAVRVFSVVARHGSISLAANELGVTPSAVSHQIKNLEERLETPLFLRGNNSIELSNAGRALLDEATAGIALIDTAVGNLLRDANEITIRASLSLAVRWLIPALEKFKQRHPKARVGVETSSLDEIAPGQSADVTITYRRYGQYDGVGEVLLTDLCQPVLAPSLLAKIGYRDPRDIAKVPALKCTHDNWDWVLWANRMAIPTDQLSFTDRFDIDDAALRAAAAGLGMVLSPRLAIDTEMRAGALVPLPGFETIELGRYYLMLGPRRDGIVGKFRNWIISEIRDSTAQSLVLN